MRRDPSGDLPGTSSALAVELVPNGRSSALSGGAGSRCDRSGVAHHFFGAPRAATVASSSVMRVAVLPYIAFFFMGCSSQWIRPVRATAVGVAHVGRLLFSRHGAGTA